MSTITKFEDIRAWQEGRQFLKDVYRVSKQSKFSQDRALKSQIRRAALSVPTNIAEGFGRGGNKEFLYFLSIASGSIRETQSLLYVALDQLYLNQDQFEQLYTASEQISNTIGAFMKYLRSTDIKGPRYNR